LPTLSGMLRRTGGFRSGSISAANFCDHHGRTCSKTGRQRTQSPRRLVIDVVTASTDGGRFARSTSITGRQLGRPPSRLWARTGRRAPLSVATIITPELEQFFPTSPYPWLAEARVLSVCLADTARNAAEWRQHERGNMADESSRRKFVRGVAAASAAVGAAGGVSVLSAQQTGRVRGFDHVALPMQNTDAMLAFYRALGCDVIERANACSVYFGDNMINFHRPVLWQDGTFTNRAPAAVPPCGDLCFVWEGTAESVKAMLDRAGAKIDVGPVPREGGRRKTGSSVYVRDPDGNLLEFMIYS
jgi:catechol 2,3-dioxygenase-like lactoylglutathione lyase family enzyme